MKRCLRPLPILLLAALPLWAQDSAQPADSLASASHQTLGERVPNTTGFALLSKSTPMELGNYPFSRVLGRIRNKWYPQIADLKKSANWRRGTTVIEFDIKQDGSLGEVRMVESAGDASLDDAASQAISSAAPFHNLPETYPGQTLRLRYYFGYDQPVSAEAPLCNGPNLGAHPTDYMVRKVGNGVAPPHPTFSPDPEYSEMARKMRYQSMVRIAGTVDPEGAFTDICVLVPGGGLDEKAMAAVKKWRFEPAVLDGGPVAVRIHVEVDFRLY